MTSSQIREKYLKFFTGRGHKRIDPAPLVLEDDPTTLFTSSGMQPLVPYLMGQKHPEGKRLVDSQPSFRQVDMEEVGDNRHTTFFEMLGNWSLGDYFKKEQLKYLFEFLTDKTEGIGLDPEKLYVTVFEGIEGIGKDLESFDLWKKLGIAEDHIHFYGTKKNWWSRSGPPELMPIGEIGGPDTEFFYEFTEIEHDKKFGEKCHPNCDCGHFMEMGNSVFIQYKKIGDGKFEKLSQQNVDFGGGLERFLAAVNNNPDIFKEDLHFPIVERICEQLGVSYGEDEKTTANLRIIADHIKAATFFIKSGVTPSNKLHGYILRRLLRRAAIKLNQIKYNSMNVLEKLVDPVIDIYEGTGYFEIGDWDRIRAVVTEEIKKFQITLQRGLKEIEKLSEVTGKAAFDLYQSYGFPPELTEELLREKGLEFDKISFDEEFKKHQEVSRTSSAGIFKGGLVGHSETEIKYHTATHLLHQALRDILGPEVFQKGSNINQERLRFDFSFNRKLTDEEIKKTEEIINKIIKEDLKVDNMMMSVSVAKEKKAIGLFDEKYAADVSIYGIGPEYTLDPEAKDQRDRAGYYSLEFCGGPHVEHTGEISGVKDERSSHFVIEKEEAVSQGIRRIRALLTK